MLGTQKRIVIITYSGISKITQFQILSLTTVLHHGKILKRPTNYIFKLSFLLGSGRKIPLSGVSLFEVQKIWSCQKDRGIETTGEKYFLPSPPATNLASLALVTPKLPRALHLEFYTPVSSFTGQFPWQISSACSGHNFPHSLPAGLSFLRLLPLSPSLSLFLSLFLFLVSFSLSSLPPSFLPFKNLWAPAAIIAPVLRC